MPTPTQYKRAQMAKDQRLLSVKLSETGPGSQRRMRDLSWAVVLSMEKGMQHATLFVVVVVSSSVRWRERVFGVVFVFGHAALILARMPPSVARTLHTVPIVPRTCDRLGSIHGRFIALPCYLTGPFSKGTGTGRWKEVLNNKAR